ncbi:MFS transporter [Kitasatospora xanthocidica]|uniref:MFS transporter n=1 Tax=Kitasatospora xanthocidica TaxID=83382 RepID=UPI0019BFE90E|nr:MFS transporter [Kitasatospora xanthocidica]GHF85262.1 MFS transporter [Kitasatospora xanthocidica]
MTAAAERPEADDPPLHRNRDFVLLWTGSALSMLGSTGATVAYPLLVLAVTGSAADAGLAGFTALLPLLLLPLPAGALVDRVDRKRLMIWCDVVRGAGALSIVLALALDRLTLTQILLVGFVEGSLTVCHELASHVAVPHLVPKRRLTEALSRNEARERAAVTLGTPLGGALFGVARALPFLLDAISYAVSVVTLLLIRKDFQAAPGGAPESDGAAPESDSAADGAGPPAKPLAELAAGFAWLWRQPFLRTAALAVAGSNLLFRALFLVVVVLADERGASPTGIGVLLGVAGAGGVLGSTAASWCRRRLPLPAVVIGANWAWALLAVGLLLADDLYLTGALYALMWFVGPIWNVAVATQQLSTTPDHLQGRVSGASSVLSGGALPLGSLAGGLLLQWYGTGTALTALAVWMVLLAGAVTLSKAVRQGPAAPDDPPASDPALPAPTDAPAV